MPMLRFPCLILHSVSNVQNPITMSCFSYYQYSKVLAQVGPLLPVALEHTDIDSVIKRDSWANPPGLANGDRTVKTASRTLGGYGNHEFPRLLRSRH